MRPSPKLAKQCRLSEGYGHKDAWLPTGSVLNDPYRKWSVHRSSGDSVDLPGGVGYVRCRTICSTVTPSRAQEEEAS